MVFGHYSITTKSLKRNELPSILQAQPGVTFQKKVRVAHILWIPLFPFANIWTMQQGDQTYQVNPQVSKVLDQKLGKIGPPWYAFAAPILIVGFMIFSSISSKMQNSKRQALMAEQTEKHVSGNFNIPSTLVYTNRQISIGTQGSPDRAFQNIVTVEIKDLNEGVDVPSEWLFY